MQCYIAVMSDVYALLYLYYCTFVDVKHILVTKIGKTDYIYLLHALTPAPEQGYLFGVNDGLYWVIYYKHCFVNTEVNDDHTRAMIGYCFCYKDPDWSNSYFISDLL